VNPFAATAAAIVAGALAGYLTAWLNVHLRIMQLLASILVMIALYSVNLRIMGKPNVALINDARCSACRVRWHSRLLAQAAGAAGDRDRRQAADRPVLRLRGRLAMRATGSNPRMARAQASRPIA